MMPILYLLFSWLNFAIQVVQGAKNASKTHGTASKTDPMDPGSLIFPSGHQTDLFLLVSEGEGMFGGRIWLPSHVHVITISCQISCRPLDPITPPQAPPRSDSQTARAFLQ